MNAWNRRYFSACKVSRENHIAIMSTVIQSTEISDQRSKNKRSNQGKKNQSSRKIGSTMMNWELHDLTESPSHTLYQSFIP